MMENRDPKSFSRSDSGDAAKSGQNGISPSFIVMLVLIGGAVIWFLQNGQQAKIHFLFFTHTTTVRWSILIGIVLGILIDRFGGMAWRKLRGKDKKDTKES